VLLGGFVEALFGGREALFQATSDIGRYFEAFGREYARNRGDVGGED
jgi:hypothetical protein